MKIIFIFILMVTSVATVCSFADEPVILEVKPIPQLSFENKKQVSGIGEYYGHGNIDGVFADRIVINDLSLYLASNINLFTTEMHTYSGSLEKGMYAYYFLNTNGKVNKIVLNVGR